MPGATSRPPTTCGGRGGGPPPWGAGRGLPLDALYNSLFRELLTYMMEDPRNISFCTHLLFCAKNVERIGDHATNIAETIHYLVTGETQAGERPKNDASNYATVQLGA